MTTYLENHEARAIASERYIIFSLPTKGQYHGFSQREDAMRNAGINFKRVKGCYKGKTEPAWIVNLQQWDKVLHLVTSVTKEECILHLDAYKRNPGARPAQLLYFNNNRPLNLGYFWPVTKDIALNCDAWTLDDGQYYITSFTKPTPSFAGMLKPHLKKAFGNAPKPTHKGTRANWYGEEEALIDEREALIDEREAHAIGGHFNKAGQARTPSGHEF